MRRHYYRKGNIKILIFLSFPLILQKSSRIRAYLPKRRRRKGKTGGIKKVTRCFYNRG